MKINEIFKSIQGESSFAGMPFIFVRLTSCNLRCTYCDTKYAYEEGFEMSNDALIEKIDSYGLKFIEITGGEPLLREEVHSLINTLIDKNYSVLVDTNGTLDISTLNQKVIRIMDIKCPGSGESDKMMWKNIDNLRPKDEVKFVIMDRDDYEWSKNIVHKYSLTENVLINFSPAYDFLEPHELAGWILKDNLKVRLNLQIHKYIWSGVERGV